MHDDDDDDDDDYDDIDNDDDNDNDDSLVEVFMFHSFAWTQKWTLSRLLSIYTEP